MCCASHLRQIGLAIKQYAEDNGDRFPPDFDALYPGYADSPKIFCCSVDFSKWKKIEDMSDINPENRSYVYVSGLNSTDPPTYVLAFCRPGTHGPDRTNALFLDTHVEYLHLDEFRRRLKETFRLSRASGREVMLIGEERPERAHRAKGSAALDSARASAV